MRYGVTSSRQPVRWISGGERRAGPLPEGREGDPRKRDRGSGDLIYGALWRILISVTVTCCLAGFAGSGGLQREG